MPLYDYECPKHGYFDSFSTIAQRDTCECPKCGTVSPHVIINAPSGVVHDYDWSSENGGKGRRIPQLSAGKNDKSCYYKNRQSAIDEAKRRNLNVITD